MHLIGLNNIFFNNFKILGTMKQIISVIYKAALFVFALLVLGAGVFGIAGSGALSTAVGKLVTDNIYYAFNFVLPTIMGMSVMNIVEYLCSLFTIARPVYENIAKSSVSAGGSTITTVEQRALRAMDLVIWTGYIFNVLLSAICLVFYPFLIYMTTGETVNWGENLFIVLVQAGLITVMYALDYGVGYMFAITGIMEDVIREVQNRRGATPSSAPAPSPSAAPITPPNAPAGRKFKRFRKVP